MEKNYRVDDPESTVSCSEIRVYTVCSLSPHLHLLGTGLLLNQTGLF